MAKASHILIFTLSGLLAVTAIPQYGQQNAAPAPSAPLPLPSPSDSGSSASIPAATSSSSSSSGGDLSVECKASPDGSGKIKYDCSGVNKDAITLKTEHFLWLENHSGNTQNLDIEIPNYNIDEFIKAAYKALGPQEGAKINISLKKPDLSYNAEKEEPPAQQVGQPSVSVNYQPVEKVSVHYPTQKGYRNGGGSS